MTGCDIDALFHILLLMPHHFDTHHVLFPLIGKGAERWIALRRSRGTRNRYGPKMLEFGSKMP